MSTVEMRSNVFFILFCSVGRPSVLFRDEHRTTNGGDAVIDMGSYPSPMKQQLQVIDETVRIHLPSSSQMNSLENARIPIWQIVRKRCIILNKRSLNWVIFSLN